MSIADFMHRVCVQTVVYWGHPVNDGFGGKTYDDPIEILCRWEDRSEVVTADDGAEVVSKAVVYVTQDVVKNGFLYLGSLTDLDSIETDHPESVEGAHRIRVFQKSPDMTATAFVRKVYL